MLHPPSRDRRRALRFENLEPRQAPGVLLPWLPELSGLAPDYDHDRDPHAAFAAYAQLESARPIAERPAEQAEHSRPREVVTDWAALLLAVHLDRAKHAADAPRAANVSNADAGTARSLFRPTTHTLDAAFGLLASDLFVQAVRGSLTPHSAVRESQTPHVTPPESPPITFVGGVGTTATPTGTTATGGAQSSPEQQSSSRPEQEATATPLRQPNDAPTDAGTDAPGSPALPLNDVNGQPLDIAPGANTLIVGAATWCGACARFKEALNAPGGSEALAGLRIVFAFGPEGGEGPGGVREPEFLQDLPGEVAFLGDGAPQPDSYPTAFNPATGQFDTSATHAVNDWLAASASAAPTESESPPESQPLVTAEPAAASLGYGAACNGPPGDYNFDCVVDAADYTVWRDTLGATGAGLAADGNGDMRVDELDYGVWKEHFGDQQPLPGNFSVTGPASPVNTATPTITWSPSVGAGVYTT